jgi:CBS domain-containing protein
MSTSTPSATPSEGRLRAEATRSMIEHTGPTAELYQSALERYLNAVSADEPPHPKPANAFPPQTVGDVMTAAVVCAHEDAAFKEVARALERNRINGVPVIDAERRVIGMVTASDLLARVVSDRRAVPAGHRLASHLDAQRKRHAGTAKELMTSPAISVTPTTMIAKAARLMARVRVRTLPVVDRDNVLQGVVTRADLVRLFLRPDADIRRDVERDVLRSEDQRRSDVHVTVDEGVVTLHGHVTQELTARRLVYEAGRVPGVVNVVDAMDFDVRTSILPTY